MQDLWQAYYRILLIILKLNKFMKLNVNSDTMRRNHKKFEACRIKYKDCDCFLAIAFFDMARCLPLQIYG